MATPKHLRAIAIALGIGALLGGALFLLKDHCPPSGLAISAKRRQFHRLKNRIQPPQQSDFDQAVTLVQLLAPGNDRERWSDTRAARVEGYVVAIAYARPELVNCYLPCQRDIHIHIALQPEAPPREHFVLEVTPRFVAAENLRRRTVGLPGLDWTENALKQKLLSHWCRFEGWLLFDYHHAGEAENLVPGATNNWRGTAWELHPVTSMELIR